MINTPKIFSFFAGSGFLDLGFELSGFHIVYVNEIYSPFMEAYRYSRASLKLPAPEYGYHEIDVTPRAGLKRFMSVEEGDDSKKSYKRLHRWRYSPTACYGNNEVHLHPYKVLSII